MRESHLEQIERWAKFVRDNPNSWQKSHSDFIDAIFENHEKFLQEMIKTPKGREKLVKLYNIKNREGYSWLI